MNLKAKLFFKCEEFIVSRENTILKTISEIEYSMLSETKSSAGDKHETGRAMLQLEREKAGNQLAEIIKVKETLSKINVEQTSQNIGLGSVIYTTKANYFIAISAGELKVENELFYAISPTTPIGQLLIGKTISDEVEFRGIKFEILKTI